MFGILMGFLITIPSGDVNAAGIAMIIGGVIGLVIGHAAMSSAFEWGREKGCFAASGCMIFPVVLCIFVRCLIGIHTPHPERKSPMYSAGRSSETRIRVASMPMRAGLMDARDAVKEVRVRKPHLD